MHLTWLLEVNSFILIKVRVTIAEEYDEIEHALVNVYYNMYILNAISVLNRQ